MFANFNMNSNAMFAMTHFLKLCYNVFILENKIDTLVFRKICVKMCYITLEIAGVCVNMERGFLLVICDPSTPFSKSQGPKAPLECRRNFYS
jgi:hypothetical protein